jgi:hypothetical protein
MFYKRASVQEIKFEIPSYNAFRRSFESSMSLFERSMCNHYYNIEQGTEMCIGTSPLFCRLRKSNICEHSYYEQDEYRQRSSVHILSEKKVYLRQSIVNEKKANKSIIRFPTLSVITLNKLNKKNTKRNSIRLEQDTNCSSSSSSNIDILKMCSDRIDAYSKFFFQLIMYIFLPSLL